MPAEFQTEYQQLLQRYLQDNQENSLYQGELLSGKMVEKGISPENIVSYHIEFLKKRFPELPQDMISSFHFLLEVMAGYGLVYREHQSLLEKQAQLASELEVAAEMQQTLLPEVPTHTPGVELGIISRAADKVSGDYYHFRSHDQDHLLSVAVADIIGKGIPAALCMSMIKYAIDSLPEESLDPRSLLKNLNRVVEKNIDPSMFITMVYGYYDFEMHRFHYASAGHEPPLYYSAAEEKYRELESKGLVLGLNGKIDYKNFSVSLDRGDMIVLFSDGVTESLKEGRFITRDEFIELIEAHRHLPGQKMVDDIHHTLLNWSEFELRDDQTIIVIKRVH